MIIKEKSYYELISSSEIKEVKKPVVIENGKRLYGNIPATIMEIHGYYKCIGAAKPNITEMQKVIAQYSLQDNIIIQSWSVEYKSISECRAVKIKALELYDSSDSVNSFYYAGRLMWFNKSDRTSLSHLAECNQKLGYTTMNLYYEGVNIELSITEAIQLLAVLEVYAGKCYNRTEQHRLAINSLNNLDDIINYDFTNGYPSVLHFAEED